MYEMTRYYIAVPKNQNFSYQTICSWKNYSFTGTYDEAVIKAIELFSEEGHFEDYIEQITNFYDTEQRYHMWEEAREAWYNEDYESMWKTAKSYFIYYFEFESDDYNKGIIEWDEFDTEYMKNWDEDEVIVTELN